MKFKILESSETNGFENEDAFFSVLRDGFHAEMEHKETVNGDFIKILEIALTHLKEDKEYYTKLKKMESGDKPQKDKTKGNKENDGQNDGQNDGEEKEESSENKDDDEDKDDETDDEEEDEDAEENDKKDKTKKNSLFSIKVA